MQLFLGKVRPTVAHRTRFSVSWLTACSSVFLALHCKYVDVLIQTETHYYHRFLQHRHTFFLCSHLRLFCHWLFLEKLLHLPKPVHAGGPGGSQSVHARCSKLIFHKREAIARHMAYPIPFLHKKTTNFGSW